MHNYKYLRTIREYLRILLCSFGEEDFKMFASSAMFKTLDVI